MELELSKMLQQGVGPYSLWARFDIKAPLDTPPVFKASLKAPEKGVVERKSFKAWTRSGKRSWLKLALPDTMDPGSFSLTIRPEDPMSYRVGSSSVYLLGKGPGKLNYSLDAAELPKSADGVTPRPDNPQEQCFYLPENAEYGRKLVVNADRTDISSVRKILTSVRVRSSHPDPKVLLVMELKDGNGKEIGWHRAKLKEREQRKKRWVPLRFSIEPEDPLPKDGSIEVYVWNKRKEPLRWDDLQLFLRTRNTSPSYSSSIEEVPKDSAPYPRTVWPCMRTGLEDSLFPEANEEPYEIFVSDMGMGDQEELLWVGDDRLRLLGYDTSEKSFHILQEHPIKSTKKGVSPSFYLIPRKDGKKAILARKDSNGILWELSASKGIEESWKGPIPEKMREAVLYRGPKGHAHLYTPGKGNAYTVRREEREWRFEPLEQKAPFLTNAGAFVHGSFGPNGERGAYSLRREGMEWLHRYSPAGSPLPKGQRLRTSCAPESTPPFQGPALIPFKPSSGKKRLLMLDKNWRFDLRRLKVGPEGPRVMGKVRFSGFLGQKDPYFYEAHRTAIGDLTGDGRTEMVLAMWDKKAEGSRSKNSDLPPSVQVYRMKDSAR